MAPDASLHDLHALTIRLANTDNAAITNVDRGEETGRFARKSREKLSIVIFLTFFATFVCEDEGWNTHDRGAHRLAPAGKCERQIVAGSTERHRDDVTRAQAVV